MISALSRRDDFLLLQRSGITRRSGPLRARVVLAENPPVGSVKLGFTIGRKFGPAVKRNRIRRRLRHSIVDAAQTTTVGTSHVLIGAAPAALSASYPELVGHCRRLLEAA
ncbi:MAG: ribonuclease P protein component [Acidimicrobiales bacterium]